MSLENLVLQPRYAPLFTEEERATARRRLEDLQFTPVFHPPPAPRETRHQDHQGDTGDTD